MDESWHREAERYMAVIRNPRATWHARVQACESLRHLLRKIEPHLAAAAREEGATWAQIGEALGVSKQAAHERYGGS